MIERWCTAKKSPRQAACLHQIPISDLVNRLARMGANVVQSSAASAMRIALQEGNDDLAKQLLELGAEPTEDLLDQAAQNGMMPTVQYLISVLAKAGEHASLLSSALFSAALRLQDASVEALLQAGARPDLVGGGRNGSSAFLPPGEAAARRAYIRTQKHIMAWSRNPVASSLAACLYGAAMRQTCISLWVQRSSPLEPAAMQHAVRICSRLIAAGADVHIMGPCKQPLLFYAVQTFSPDLVAALLNGGVDVYARDRSGQTALHHAIAKAGHYSSLAKADGCTTSSGGRAQALATTSAQIARDIHRRKRELNEAETLALHSMHGLWHEGVGPAELSNGTLEEELTNLAVIVQGLQQATGLLQAALEPYSG